MSIERSTPGVATQRLLDARRALEQASDDAQIARAHIAECEAMIALKSLASRAEQDSPTVRAARVFRGQLSPAIAIEQARLLDTRRAEALEALLDVIDDDSLRALLDPPFSASDVNSSLVIDELSRRRRFDLILERARPGRLRPIEISWRELVESTTESQRANARRACDRLLAEADFETPADTQQARSRRFAELLWLCDRTLLEPPDTRVPWIERATALLDANADTVRTFQSDATLRALTTIAWVECAEPQRALEQWTRCIGSNPAALNAKTAAANQLYAALSALQSALSPEQLEEVEEAVFLQLERAQGVRSPARIELARRLRSPVCDRAFERAVATIEVGEWWLTGWLDDVPLRFYRERAEDAAAQFPSRVAQYVRGGRSWDEVCAALRLIPASGPWVSSIASAIGDAAVANQPMYSHSHRFATRWLFEAARRGNPQAKQSILRAATETRHWWDAEPRWYRGLDEATIDALIDARAQKRDVPLRFVWLKSLTNMRVHDAEKLRAVLGPRALAYSDDGFLLKHVAPHVRPEDEHAVVCAALDGFAREPGERWAGALIELANHCSNAALARKCLRRYLDNTSALRFDRARLARAMARVGDEPRVRASLARAFAKRVIPAEFLPVPARCAWLRSLDVATPVRAEHWSTIELAVMGLDDEASKPAVEHAIAALFRARIAPPTPQSFSALLQRARAEDLALALDSLPRSVTHVVSWSSLVAAVIERAPSLFETAISRFATFVDATSKQPVARWHAALVDAARGDLSAIARAYNDVQLRQFSSMHYRVVRALPAMDALVDAIVARPDLFSIAVSGFVWSGWELLTPAQLERMRPLLEAQSARWTRWYEIEQHAQWMLPRHAARVWSRRSASSTHELPSPNVVRALAGAEGVERVCALLEAQLDAP